MKEDCFNWDEKNAKNILKMTDPKYNQNLYSLLNQ